MSLDIRKLVTVVDETLSEMGRAVSPSVRRAAAIVVVANPFAGRYVEDLTPLIEAGEELGKLLSERAVAALGIKGPEAQGYGKAALVGENGEMEHAAALLHPKMGAPVRKTVGKGAALIPSSKKRGGPGAELDIPLGHKDAAFVRSHFDGMQVSINDAPRANEIVVAVAVTTGGGGRCRGSAASKPRTLKARMACAERPGARGSDLMSLPDKELANLPPDERESIAADYVLDSQVGFILRQASQRHTALFASRMGAEITPTQWAALAKLHEVSPTSQNQLGRMTAMDVATIKGVVDRLMKRGLVRSMADKGDARRRLLMLSEQGQTSVEANVATAHAITRETLAPLAEREKALFIALLGRLR